MKIYFSEPELNISHFRAEDVIATSVQRDPDELPIVPASGN